MLDHLPLKRNTTQNMRQMHGMKKSAGKRERGKEKKTNAWIAASQSFRSWMIDSRDRFSVIVQPVEAAEEEDPEKDENARTQKKKKEKEKKEKKLQSLNT